MTFCLCHLGKFLVPLHFQSLVSWDNTVVGWSAWSIVCSLSNCGSLHLALFTIHQVRALSHLMYFRLLALSVPDNLARLWLYVTSSSAQGSITIHVAQRNGWKCLNPQHKVAAFGRARAFCAYRTVARWFWRGVLSVRIKMVYVLFLLYEADVLDCNIIHFF